MTDEGDPLLYEVDPDANIATITLNRPERRNSLTPAMVELWIEALRDARRNPHVKAVIVTGAGDRAFCGGGDLVDGPLQDPTAHTPVAHYRNIARIHEVAWELRRLDKPYLAALNGAAIGVGMDVASMADLRFASSTARVGMGYINVGLIPGDGGAFYLPRLVGLPRALHLIWTGQIIDAEQALTWGYVTDVFPPDDLMAEVWAYARRLAEGPGLAIRAAKRLVYRSLEMGEEQALELAANAQPLMMSTDDAREGTQAFRDKRPPRYRDQ